MCHGVIDPTGLALENFDAIGAWRTVDNQAKAPIDASTVLPNGVAINGVVELRAQLVDRPATFVTAVTERLMMYAIAGNWNISICLRSFDCAQGRER
jgi:hypothetical protein